MSKIYTDLCPFIISRARIGCVTPQHPFLLPTKDKFYAVFEDYGTTLRACRIVSVLYGSCFGETFLQLEVAGIGRGYVAADSKFYHNADDFLANRRIVPLSIENGKFYIEDEVNGIVETRLNTYCPIDRYEFYRYAWQNNRVTDFQCYVKAEYFVAEDYLEVDCEPISYESWKDYKSYLSKDECLYDNKVDVADFDDTESKSYDVTIEVIKTITTTIKATSKESVVKAARTAFEGKDIKVFINGEVEYEP